MAQMLGRTLEMDLGEEQVQASGCGKTGYESVPEDCSRYRKCEFVKGFGFLVYEMTCPTGMLFDNDIKACSVSSKCDPGGEPEPEASNVVEVEVKKVVNLEGIDEANAIDGTEGKKSSRLVLKSAGGESRTTETVTESTTTTTTTHSTTVTTVRESENGKLLG